MSESQTTMPCTPAQHTSTSNTKPVRLLALGDGPHGKTALCEFPEGWQRTIDLPTQADAWHPLFEDLTADDKGKLRKHTDHPIVRHADGTRTRQGALSFITQEVSRNGGWRANAASTFLLRATGRAASRDCAARLNCCKRCNVAMAPTFLCVTSPKRQCRPATRSQRQPPGAVLVTAS